MTTTQELTLLRADLKRPDLRHGRPWMRARIRQLQAELRQEHKAFLRVLEIQRKAQAYPGTDKTVKWLLTPMSPDTWLGPKRRRMEQNCEVNPDL